VKKLVFSSSAETSRMPPAFAADDTCGRGEGQAAGLDRAL
jgi:hypothetical protein